MTLSEKEGGRGGRALCPLYPHWRNCLGDNLGWGDIAKICAIGKEASPGFRILVQTKIESQK